MRALFLVLMTLSSVKLYAQNTSWQASSIGSYQKEVSNSYFSRSLLLVEDMDNGTSFHLRQGAAVLHISKEDDLIFISSINANNTDQSVMILATLPIKIAPNTYVEFNCQQGRFIYIQELK